VTAVDAKAHSLDLASGRKLACDKLLRRPGGMYALWLVKTKAGKIVHARPITSRWRPPKADGRGILRVATSLSDSPATEDTLLLRYHAPGVSLSFEAGVSVLQGDLPRSR
jgi:hypothetical protein